MQTTPSHRIPPDRHQSLVALLSQLGPYRRDQLRQRLLSAARACTDEAASLRRSEAAFASATGVPKSSLPLPCSRLPTTPEGWEAEASAYAAMADVVSAYRPAFHTNH